LIRGIKTLAVRVERQNATALEVARYLESHSKVEKVHYPGLESHPQHALAKKQLRGFGGMMSFEVKGGEQAGRTLIESVKVITLAVSLGGVESLIQHPASCTHAMVPREKRLKAGITDGMIRFSIGLEDSKDLIKDLEQALAKI
jgi:methionine-gamma-lyase